MIQIECDLVVFDNDGVVCDSHVGVEAAWAWATKEFGLPETFQFQGMTAWNILASHLPTEDVAAAHEAVLTKELELISTTVEVPGAIDLMTSLPEGRWGMATSASKTLALARLEAIGAPIPQVLVTADDVTHSKPHPEPYQQAIERLGGSDDVVVFEDSVAGLASARAAGARVVHVATSNPTGTVEADWSVPDLHSVSLLVR